MGSSDNAFIVKRVPGRGRCVVAKRKLRAGEVVLREEPWALVLLAEELGLRCDFSLCSGQKLLRCPSTGLCFGSKDEQRAAAELYYKAELKAAAAVAESSRGRTKSSVPLHFTEWPATLRLAVRALHRGALAGGQRPWSNLESHWEDLDSQREQSLEEHAARCLDVVAAGQGLLTSQGFDVDVAPQEANQAFRSLADIGNVAQLLAALDINAMTVTDEEQRDIALGLYLKGAAFNHGEEPNCVQSFVGRQLLVRTCRPVEEEEELTITYAELAELSSNRRARLRTQYYFDPAPSGKLTSQVQERDDKLSSILCPPADSSKAWTPIPAGVGWCEDSGVQDSLGSPAVSFVQKVHDLWAQAQAARQRGFDKESVQLLKSAWESATAGSVFRLGEGHALRLALSRELMDAMVSSESWQDAAVFAREVCACNRKIYPPAWPVTSLSLARLAKLELYLGRFAAAAWAGETALRGEEGAEVSPATICWEDRPKAAEELQQILAQVQAEVGAYAATAKPGSNTTKCSKQKALALTICGHESAVSMDLESLD
eukprot:TRINITY_DN43115_c0_g1_i1.p1 TRINITY_DN43115_c0_g1~~TRINITY_DN43115_c0_g1_i1.p1  ORF type:complete len:544 (+),score=136.50 TRINITY_DN43115_c0_g1_i1:60-1691(+)